MQKPIELTGRDLLRDPRLNKGSAFTEAERRQYHLEGLLPPGCSSLELQVARTHTELAALDNDLQKYLLLSDLQARNETLFYATIMSDPATFMPLVYTPTVGEACQKFNHIFRATRGMYVPISARGRVKELLQNWPEKDVRFIVVTDGERILGLGDLGVGGMGIPIGKLSLYTACAGVPPQYCLPVMLDVGTNNRDLLDDPLYLGLRQERVRGDEYHAFVNEFVEAAQELHPKCCVQWEDFANFNAVPLLARYKDKICTYNDDIQGTAAVALAGIFAALHISKQKLVDQRFLFLGGGSAGTGIAELISQAMVLEGLSIDEARARNALFDVNGLMVKSRQDLADFQKPFAVDHAPVDTFADAVKALKPTGIIGVSTVPVVRRARYFRQRQPVPAGGNRRAHVCSRTGQQRLYFPRAGDGRVRYAGEPRDGRDVYCRGESGGRAGLRSESCNRPDLSAAEQDFRGVASCGRARGRVYFRQPTGACAQARRHHCTDPQLRF
jgi:malate dehydrogenase (oxaloacetate-decarboxylating)(NADP+)